MDELKVWLTGEMKEYEIMAEQCKEHENKERWFLAKASAFQSVIWKVERILQEERYSHSEELLK